MTFKLLGYFLLRSAMIRSINPFVQSFKFQAVQNYVKMTERKETDYVLKNSELLNLREGNKFDLMVARWVDTSWNISTWLRPFLALCTAQFHFFHPRELITTIYDLILLLHVRIVLLSRVIYSIFLPLDTNNTFKHDYVVFSCNRNWSIHNSLTIVRLRIEIGLSLHIIPFIASLDFVFYHTNESQ